MNKTFRFIFSAIAVMFLFGGFAAVSTNAQGIPNKILTLMEEHRKAMTSLKAEITMDNYDNVLKDSDQKSGTVKYAAIRKNGKDVDALMRLDWIKPKNEIVSVIKKTFVIWDVKGGIAYTGSADSKKVKGEGGSGLVKLLTNSSKEDLKSKFSVEYLGEERVSNTAVWHLKLTPKTKQDYKFADIWIDGNGMPLQAMTTALNNDTQTVRLSNLDKNPSLTANEFTVDVPKGVKKQAV
jgi:outer membrane lipoprotein-sorting protein